MTNGTDAYAISSSGPRRQVREHQGSAWSPAVIRATANRAIGRACVTGSPRAISHRQRAVTWSTPSTRSTARPSPWSKWLRPSRQPGGSSIPPSTARRRGLATFFCLGGDHRHDQPLTPSLSPIKDAPWQSESLFLSESTRRCTMPSLDGQRTSCAVLPPRSNLSYGALSRTRADYPPMSRRCRGGAAPANRSL